MSSRVSCPHCAGQMESSPDLAGRVVSCPHCRGQLTMPAPTVVSVPSVRQPRSVELFDQGQQIDADRTAPQQPVIMINTAPRTQKRLHAGNWFTRAFGTTTGIVLGLLLIPTAGMCLLMGGCGLLFTAADSAVQSDSKQRAGKYATAARFALPHLRSHGIVELASDGTYVDGVDGPVILTKGKGTDGRMRDVKVSFTIATFGGNEQWQIDHASIDSQIVILDGKHR